jgi:Protein of unknown function (DUF3800)
MLYNCFLDDSKDQTQTEFYICAGFIGDCDNWSALRVLWKQCLAEHKIGYFKSQECKMLQGQFARFRTAAYPEPAGRQAANRIRDELLGNARCVRGIAGIGVAIPVQIYKKIGKRPEAAFFGAADPYRRALEGVFNEAMRQVEALPGENEVAFVHDEETDWHDLENYYHEYKELNPRHAQKMKGFTPLDDKEHPPLQLADAIANYALSVGREWLRNDHTPVMPEQELFNLCKFGIWDEHIMLCILKHNLLGRDLPIPDDLRSSDYD